ncbi:unnamed protein product [Staurois parvus]|uniref:Interferon regulatory factor-3 domain-containing protein n=1 Tax=Staurois parvus TaxID=386267 RepID=A0ABN9F4V8_9NEOB|nr:unnamed protein product [Staurois parvus]
MDCSSSEMETSAEDFLVNIKRSPSPAKDSCQKPGSHDWWMYPHSAGMHGVEGYNVYPNEPVPPGFSQMIIHFYYGGKAVSQVTTTRVEGCRLSLHPPISTEKYYPLEGFENIQFPPAEYIMSERQRQITKKLFGHLERGGHPTQQPAGNLHQEAVPGPGVLERELHAVQRPAGQAGEGRGHQDLRHQSVHLRDFQHCYSNQMRLPDSKVTLCFGEEFPDATPLHMKLIIVQVEQLGLRQLLESSTKNYNMAGLHLVPDSQMDSIQRHLPDPCTTHQRAFYRDTPQITV